MQFAHLDFNIEKSNSVDLGNSFGNFSVILEAHVRGCCFFFCSETLDSGHTVSEVLFLC